MTEAARGTNAMYIDSWEADVQSMPQGTGQDHTLWDWSMINSDGADKIVFYRSRVEDAEEEIKDVQDLIDDFWTGMTSTEVTNQLSCELHRNEEINLYYQCTQNTYNNYALDHFGGEMRSYPRWIYEFKRCNILLHKAECCTIRRDGIDYECPPCTDITMPMPHPFGDDKPKPEPKPEPKVCDPLPDYSMLSVYRFMGREQPLDRLREDSTWYCIEQRAVDKYTATLNIKMPGNVKFNWDYEIRLNQEDCTTVELRPAKDETYAAGGTLMPYGAPYEGYDAFYFNLYPGFEVEKFDTKVGTCECDDTTGMCAANYWEYVEQGLY